MTTDRLPVIVAAADIESGVTSWALRFRDACRQHPRLDVRLINCWNTGKGVGDFDAHISSEDEMRRYLRALPRAVVVPNFVWELFPLCASLAAEGHAIYTLGYARSDSEAEYYAPLTWMEPLAGAFLASSPECALHLAEHIPHRAGEIIAAPSGVVVPAQLDRAWQTAPLRLIYAGRMVQEQKRVLDFIPLIEHLLARKVDFSLTLLGSGAQREALRLGVEALPHRGRVRLLDSVPSRDMPAIWRQHDVFVQASEYEGTSSSMLEAMAQGCVPVVCDATSGIRGVVSPGVNGAIVPIGDMAAMAEQIGLLAGNAGMLASHGAAAHATVLDYAMPRYLERFEQAVAWALAQPPRTWPKGAEHARVWAFGGGLWTPLESRRRFLRPAFSVRLVRRGVRLLRGLGIGA